MLLTEIPEPWRPFFELLASTGLRISEAIALRVLDAELDVDAPRIHVRRAIVSGQLTAPQVAARPAHHPDERSPRACTPRARGVRGETELLFVGARGAALRPGNLRHRVMIPTAECAGVP